MAPRLFTLRGETHSLREWSRALKIPYHTLNGRLYAGVPFEQALQPPSTWSRKQSARNRAIYKAALAGGTLKELSDRFGVLTRIHQIIKAEGKK